MEEDKGMGGDGKGQRWGKVEEKQIGDGIQGTRRSGRNECKPKSDGWDKIQRG